MRLESCQQSHMISGVRLQYISLAFYLSVSHILGTNIVLWDIVKLESLNENKMGLNSTRPAFIIFLGINSGPRSPLWAKVLELLCTEHAH